ncbi:unnamed protein product [Pleuronectes platessa]|uniref:Uncharacterized protein n=1 Tax=Pleuronectes platessa TaxID=8262 RepID=A0A9N7YKC2_PLEPL|nr:unnamed protein product [Pleuronectes platessa]
MLLKSDTTLCSAVCLHHTSAPPLIISELHASNEGSGYRLILEPVSDSVTAPSSGPLERQRRRISFSRARSAFHVIVEAAVKPGWKQQQQQLSDVTDYAAPRSPGWREGGPQTFRGSPACSPPFSPSRILHKTDSINYTGHTSSPSPVPQTPAFPVSPPTPYVKHFSEVSQRRTSEQWEHHSWTPASVLLRVFDEETLILKAAVGDCTTSCGPLHNKCTSLQQKAFTVKGDILTIGENLPHTRALSRPEDEPSVFRTPRVPRDRDLLCNHISSVYMRPNHNKQGLSAEAPSRRKQLPARGMQMRLSEGRGFLRQDAGVSDRQGSRVKGYEQGSGPVEIGRLW